MSLWERAGRKQVIRATVRVRVRVRVRFRESEARQGLWAGECGSGRVINGSRTSLNERSSEKKTGLSHSGKP